MNSNISTAIAALKSSQDGKTIKGTRALISAIQERTGFPQSRIAEISQCSVAGIQRWVSLDSGQKTRLAPLIQYARSLAEQPEGGGIVIEEPPMIASSFAEAVRALTLGDIEKEFRSSLQRLSGVALETCEITRLESRDGIVNFELRIK
jgi:hypothetical protein